MTGQSTHQNLHDGRNVISAGTTPNIKEEPASKPASKASPSPNTQSSNYSNGAPSNHGTQSKESFSQRKCYYCGKYGHLARDCNRRKHVNVANVPTLAEIPDEALTVSGSIDKVPVPYMLCDSGATISVIADALIPKHVPLQEEVLVITATGLATPYPTALVPATVNGREMELFAAVVPAEKMTYPVILGRFIPNMEVKWTMEVGNDEGTLLKLQQTTEAQELPSVLQKVTKTSRRKHKFKTMSLSEKVQTIEMEVANDEALVKLQPMEEAQELLPVLQKTQSATKTSRRKTKFKPMVEKKEMIEQRVQFKNDTDARSGVVAGEPTSQEVEERADTIPLSNSGKQVCPGESKPNQHKSGLTTVEIHPSTNLETFTTMAVQTRAQSKKQSEHEEADEAATTASGVILTPIQREDDVPDVTASDCDDAVATTLAQPTGCEEAQSNDDTTGVTRTQLIEMQLNDPALRPMFLEADGEDSLFHVKNGLLYRKRYLEAEEDDYQIVVPTTLRCKIMQAGHDQSGHFEINKTKVLIQKHFYWPRMGQEINQYCKTCPSCLKFNYKKRSKEPLHPLPVISTPWRRIAIDIVGKMPRTQRGNSYILTIMDFATRYMEAIPLKRVDAHTTCSALMEVFARWKYCQIMAATSLLL